MPESTIQPQPVKSEFNLYTVSKWEIFSKNFIAGLGRSLGSIVIYFIFLAILGFAASRFLLPQLQPLIQNFTNLQNPQLNPNQLQQLFNQPPR